MTNQWSPRDYLDVSRVFECTAMFLQANQLWAVMFQTLIREEILACIPLYMPGSK